MVDSQGIPQTDAEMEAYLNSALPLQDACLFALALSGESGTNQRMSRQEDLPQALPIVWIDIQTMPEFADLGRVHKMDGEGEPILTWVYWDVQSSTSIFVLEVQLEKPVRASFHVPFPVKERQGLLGAIAEYGVIWFVPGPPLDYRRMMQTMDQATLFRTIREKCGNGVTITLNLETRAEVKRYLEAWKRRFSNH